MNVETIIREWLKKNGYDGLCNPSISCGCFIEDLQPCESVMIDCEPAYVHVCDECKEKDACPDYEEGGHCFKKSSVQEDIK